MPNSIEIHVFNHQDIPPVGFSSNVSNLLVPDSNGGQIFVCLW